MAEPGLQPQCSSTNPPTPLHPVGPAVPQAPLQPAVPQAPQQPAQTIVHLNWTHIKPKFSGKPDEDAEGHLL